MNKTTSSIPVLFLLIGVFIFLGFQRDNNSNKTIAKKSEKFEKIKIAACPTCLEAAKKLNSEKYEIVQTVSTGKSFALLARGDVDMILSGRTLMPNESAGDFLALAEGYSFLSNESQTVYINEIKNATIFSDIDPNELKQKLPGFVFKQVDDVYKYLEEGIVLTTWENTDYSRAQIVHVVERDGKRLAMSRRPTLYCSISCNEEAETEIKSVFD